MIPSPAFLLLAVLFAPPSADQAPAPARPYAGQEARAIKALAPEEVGALLRGEGMGLAKAAELNSHPGPRHVLDLKVELGLTPAQVDAVRAAYDRMHAAAVRLGAAIVARERALDARFARADLDREALRSEVAAIARLQGELRAAHLEAHIATRAVLTAGQIAAYDARRGYGAAAHHPGRHR